MLILHVKHGKEPAAVVDMDPKTGTARMEWLQDFRRSSESLLLPFERRSGLTTTSTRSKPDAAKSTSGTTTDAGIQSFQALDALPPFLADHLPGTFARTLLNENLKVSGRTADGMTSLGWLSLLGNRGYGALGFEPAGYPEMNTPEPVDLDRMVHDIGKILEGKAAEISEKRRRDVLRCCLFTRGDSPKLLVAVNDFTGEVLSGQGQVPPGFESWILKLDGVIPGSGVRLGIEHEQLLAARKCGIRTVESRLLKDGPWQHLLLKRIDRKDGKKTDFFSMEAFGSSHTNSWESVFRALRRLRLPYTDTEELFRRMIFLHLNHTEDILARRICFAWNPVSKWTLAPAFHLAPLSTETPSGWLIKGSFTDAESLLDFGRTQGIKKRKALYKQCEDVLNKD